MHFISNISYCTGLDMFDWDLMENIVEICDMRGDKEFAVEKITWAMKLAVKRTIDQIGRGETKWTES